MSESNGASIQGDVNTGGDFVGRDQIQNIIIVGRFLDYAGIQGLLPQIKDLSDVDSVAAALDQALRQRAQGDLTQAVAFAGSLLRDLLPSGSSFTAGRPVPYRKIATGIAYPLIDRLKAAGYWEDLSHVVVRKALSEHGNRNPKKYVYIPLESTNALFNKHFGQDTSERIALIEEINHVSNEVIYSYFGSISALETNSSFEPAKFENWNSREFRVFFTGLVLDLIRIAATVEDDHHFWESLIDLLGPAS